MTARELPRWLRLLAGVSLALVALPLLGLLVRVPWAELPVLLADPDAQQALWLSLRTCVASTLLAVVAGTPLALVLSRAEGAWAHAARTLSALPMVLPPVVAGLALLVAVEVRAAKVSYRTLPMPRLPRPASPPAFWAALVAGAISWLASPDMATSPPLRMA